MAKVGIFSGTFDPVHVGHIGFAVAAAREVQLEKIILLPERQPRSKAGVTPFADRVAMLKLATQKQPFFEVVEFDEQRFTIDTTLPKLQQRYDRDLSLLIGSDVAQIFADRWPGLDKLLEQMGLIIALRNGDSESEIKKLMSQIGAARFLCIASPKEQAASSKIRIGNAKTQLDPNVQTYIATKRLYPLALGTN